MVFRTRYVGQGMREDLEIRNFGDEPTVCLVEVFVAADFADLFAVKEGRAGADPERVTDVDGSPHLGAAHDAGCHLTPARHRGGGPRHQPGARPPRSAPGHRAAGPGPATAASPGHPGDVGAPGPR